MSFLYAVISINEAKRQKRLMFLIKQNGLVNPGYVLYEMLFKYEKRP